MQKFFSRTLFAFMLITIVSCAPSIKQPLLNPTSIPIDNPSPIQTVIPEPAASPTETQIPTLAPTATQVRRDPLIFAQIAEPDTLHPLMGCMSAREILNSALYAPCTYQAPDGSWQPEMCTEVPTVENGGAKWIGWGSKKHLEVTFHLRPDWTWHDGQPVTARDYVFTYNLAMDPYIVSEDFGSLGSDCARGDWLPIESLQAVDEHTLLVRYHSQASLQAEVQGKGSHPKLAKEYELLQKSYGDGPAGRVYYYTLPIVLPEHILKNIPAKNQLNSDFAHNPIGNGAYQLTRWNMGKGMYFMAYENFALGAPKIKRLEIHWIYDMKAIIQGIKSGEIDGMTSDTQVNASQPGLLKDLESTGYKLISQPWYGWSLVELNTSLEPFDDPLVRQALAYATDKETLIQQVDYGMSIIQDSPIPSMHWSFSPEAVTKYPFDIQKAREVLKSAGWDCSKSPCTKMGWPLQFKLATTERADRKQIVQFLKETWEKAGFSVEIDIKPGRELFNSQEQGGILSGRTFQAAMFTWLQDAENPGLYGLYGCESIPTAKNKYQGYNYSGWCRKDIDAKIKATEQDAVLLTDPVKLKAAVAEVLKAWTQDLPAIPLDSSVSYIAVRPDLLGYQPQPFFNNDFWNAYTWEIAP